MDVKELEMWLNEEYGDKVRVAVFTPYHLRVGDGETTIDLWPFKYWHRFKDGDLTHEIRGKIYNKDHKELIRSIFD